MIYQAYVTQADVAGPARWFADALATALGDQRCGLPDLWPVRKLAAAFEVFARAALTHKRPSFGIHQVLVIGEPYGVDEEPVLTTPFGTLLHFRKDVSLVQPPVLVVAPMSGHFATLLRETVRTLLSDHDVYVTDWHNARDVPLAAGDFGFDDYVGHLIRFIEAIGPRSHLVAVCQPCVATLAAVALMAEDNHVAQPRTMTLMAGPIDCRINPTAVNRLANSKPLSWFEQQLISRVPWRFRGANRRVYPGFVQLTAFMSMNPDRHLNAFRELYRNLADGNLERATTIRAFYEEYFAVADLPAEFYLETVGRVFQQYQLPLGELHVHGRRVDARAIRRTALLTVEGERDDVCAVGQTLAAHDLCASLRPTQRAHYVQTGVGHYGVFSGKRWNRGIYPILRDTIFAHA
jgi:poly(3-hydroxybutyrate) depolymerase